MKYRIWLCWAISSALASFGCGGSSSSGGAESGVPTEGRIRIEEGRLQVTFPEGGDGSFSQVELRDALAEIKDLESRYSDVASVQEGAATFAIPNNGCGSIRIRGLNGASSILDPAMVEIIGSIPYKISGPSICWGERRESRITISESKSEPEYVAIRIDFGTNWILGTTYAQVRDPAEVQHFSVLVSLVEDGKFTYWTSRIRFDSASGNAIAELNGVPFLQGSGVTYEGIPRVGDYMFWLKDDRDDRIVGLFNFNRVDTWSRNQVWDPWRIQITNLNLCHSIGTPFSDGEWAALQIQECGQ